MNQLSQPPILYSLRNCPYAMRARIGLYMAQQLVEVREVKLTNKPEAMLAASAKGTVPILQTERGIVDQSLDIMLWALKRHDPNDLLYKATPEKQPHMLALITIFDEEFKGKLEQYKCVKRYHGAALERARSDCEHYLAQLERRLTQHPFLFGQHLSLADIAIMPFIRQIARVERQWYLSAPYPNLRQWLDNMLQSVMFSKVMTKYPIWSKGACPVMLAH